jgi:Recombinase/Recombinase zinc beta ribbon domain
VESMGLFGVVISKMEVRKMQRRMRRSHRARAEQGIAPLGGNRPFGWQDNRKALELVEAQLLRRAAREFVVGRSLTSIVAEWQRLGVKTSRGNTWTAKSLKVTLSNARLCGWREINGELIRDATGTPVVGDWEPVLTPDEWQAVRGVFDTRRGRVVHPDGTVGGTLPQDFREHRYLLTGVVRCGRPGPDGVICNTRLRVTRQKDCKQHIYSCPSKTAGGCGGLGRRGDKVDEFVSEAVLAKLEQRRLVAVRDAGPWPAQTQLADLESRLGELRAQWRARKISNELFFTEVPHLESEIGRLRGERERHQAVAQRARTRAETDTSEIRRRWSLSEEDGGLPLSTKRAYVREALHAIVVHPIGGGHGRLNRFDPTKLELIWRA